MTKPLTTRNPSAVHAARTTVLTYALLAYGVAQAADPCPHFSGTYQLAGETLAVTGVLQVLDVGIGLADYVGGILTIAADEAGQLSVQARPRAIDPLQTYGTRTLLSPLDYSCKGGWIVIQRPTKSGRNVGQSSYEGLLTLRFKPLATANDDSLQVELTFKGHKTVNLFSYDSAHVDIGIPWSRYSDTAKMEWVQTASRGPMLSPTKVEAPVESPAVQRVRVALTPAILQDVRLNDLAPVAKGVIAGMTARRTQELDALEQRMRTAGLVFAIEGKPVWTSERQSYWLEVRFPNP